jgi:hypothetical protein
VPGLLLVGVLAVSLEADLTPFTQGANDNASGAGIVLSLAEGMAAKPLRETDVWVLLSGCEEVGCYGAEAFLRSHKEDLDDAFWLTLDSVGAEGTSPCYLTRETFLLTTNSDPVLLAIADTVTAENPSLGARRHQFRGAYTEGAIGGKHGLRVLTFLATRPSGAVPNWHRTTDVLEGLDEGVLARTESFVREILTRIDAL